MVKQTQTEKQIPQTTQQEKTFSGYIQFGCRPEELREYVCIRSFWLTTRFGPQESIPVGAMCWLTKQLGDELFFAGRIKPKRIGTRFKVIQAIRTVDEKTKEWIDVRPGAIIRLSETEALQYLRERKVIEEEDGADETENTSSTLAQRQ